MTKQRSKTPPVVPAGDCTLAQLVGPWTEPVSQTSLIERRRLMWEKPLGTMTKQELATCLRQQLAVEAVIVVAKKGLIDRPEDDSELYDGQLAEAIADVERRPPFPS